MTRDLLVRGFNNETHSELGVAAENLGVSLNSIVKDAVDKWLKNYSQIPKKHALVLYDDNESLLRMLKSMDGIASDGGWFRCFCGSSSHPAVKLLNKLRWFNATAQPYSMLQKNAKKFFSLTVDKIVKTTKGKQICLFDFAIEEYARTSLKDAIQLETGYNSNKLAGLVFCPYQITILEKDISSLLEIFEAHDQVFIIRNSEIYKIHITKENIHKLFLN